MGRLLVHVTHGPEAPTRAALGLLVAKAAIDEGHRVDVFLAGGIFLVAYGLIASEHGAHLAQPRDAVVGFRGVPRAGVRGSRRRRPT